MQVKDGVTCYLTCRVPPSSARAAGCSRRICSEPTSQAGASAVDLLERHMWKDGDKTCNHNRILTCRVPPSRACCCCSRRICILIGWYMIFMSMTLHAEVGEKCNHNRILTCRVPPSLGPAAAAAGASASILVLLIYIRQSISYWCHGKCRKMVIKSVHATNKLHLSRASLSRACCCCSRRISSLSCSTRDDQPCCACASSCACSQHSIAFCSGHAAMHCSKRTAGSQ